MNQRLGITFPFFSQLFLVISIVAFLFLDRLPDKFFENGYPSKNLQYSEIHTAQISLLVAIDSEEDDSRSGIHFYLLDQFSIFPSSIQYSFVSRFTQKISTRHQSFSRSRSPPLT